MKKISGACLILCIICLLVSFAMPVMATQVSEDSNETVQELGVSVTSGCHGLDAQVPVMGTYQLVPNMESAFLFDIDTETLMYAFNADVQMSPASMVKIMTTLIAVEKGTLTDIVEVKKSVLDSVPFDAVSAGLLAGEKITLENLLYCMMVGAANDAAAVIADHISGSQEAFVEEMNQYAKELGCTATKFMNPHGLHNSEQVTTARDMGKILFHALKNQDFVKFFSEVYYNVPATNMSESRYFASSNFLMNNAGDLQIYYDSRVTGGRTGVAEDGKRCLAAVAQSGDRTLISIVMGSITTYAEDGFSVIRYGTFPETTKLLTMGFDGYKAVQILYDGQILRQCAVINGENSVVIGPKTSAYTVLPENVTVSDLTYRYFDVEEGIVAPINAGDKLSHVQVWHDNICIAQADLFAVGSVRTVASQDPQNMPQNPSGNWYNIIFVILAVVAGVVMLLLIIRFVQRLRLAKLRKRGRQYRKSRRRSR